MYPSNFLALLFVTFLLVVPSHTYPLEARAQSEAVCKDGNQGPCICPGRALTIRDKTVGKHCGEETFQFTSENPDDGTVKLVPQTPSEVSNSETVKTTNCDHMVELTFIAQQITKNEAICEKLVVGGGNNDIYRALFNAVNGQNNLVIIPTDVNHAKSLALTASKKSLFLRSSKKAKTGVNSFLTQINQNTNHPSLSLALSTIGATVEPLSEGFTKSFTNNYNQLVATAISLSNPGPTTSAPSSSATSKPGSKAPAGKGAAQKAAAPAPVPAPAPAVKGAAPLTTSGAAAQKAAAPAPPASAPVPAVNGVAPKASASAKPAGR